jgi:hypothetical protein
MNEDLATGFKAIYKIYFHVTRIRNNQNALPGSTPICKFRDGCTCSAGKSFLSNWYLTERIRRYFWCVWFNVGARRACNWEQIESRKRERAYSSALVSRPPFRRVSCLGYSAALSLKGTLYRGEAFYPPSIHRIIDICLLFWDFSGGILYFQLLTMIPCGLICG